MLVADYRYNHSLQGKNVEHGCFDTYRAREEVEIKRESVRAWIVSK